MKHYRISDKPKLFFSICVNSQNTLHISTDLRLLCLFPTRRLEQCSSYWYSGLKANMLSVLWLWQFCLTHCMACSCGRSFVYNFKEMRKCSVPCRSFPSSVAAGKMRGSPRGLQACCSCVLLRQRMLSSSWHLDKRERPLTDGRRTSPSLRGFWNQNKPPAAAALLWPPHLGLTYWRKRLLFIKAHILSARRMILAVKCKLKKKEKPKPMSA